MANTKQKIDRWSSSSGNTIIHVTQPKNTRTPTIELSATSTMPTKDDAHRDQ